MSLPDKEFQMLRVAIAGGLAALAAWSFRAVFADGATGILLLAIVIPMAVAIGWGCLTVMLGQRAYGATGTALAVASVLIAVATVTQPGLDARLGPSRLLTGILPTDPAGPQLATVSALAGLAALFAVRLAVRPNGAMPALLPALCCLLLGLGLGASVAPLPGWYAPVFALTAMALVLIGRGVTKGRLVSGAVVMVVAATAGAVLGPFAAADRRPANLQALVDAQVLPREQINPMVQYLALRDGLLPLEITGTASEHADRIRMVTLNQFDGLAWSVSADYRRAGTQLPQAPARGREVALDLRVLTPSSIGWLPRAGRPTRITVPGLGFDQGTGDIVVPADRETPSAYRVVGSEPVLSVEDLQADDPVPDAITPDLPLPQEVSAFVDSATAGRSAGLGKFLGLYQAMTDPAFRYDTSRDARGGHGLRQVSELLQRKRGTSEQYASAFAVMCRQLGWDARVVLGFRPTWDGDRLRIEGQDVFAWVEVRFRRLGWVPVDPSPPETIDQQNRPGAQQQRNSDPVSNVVPPDQHVPQEPGNTPPPEVDGKPASRSTVDVGTILAAASLALVLFIAAIPLLKTIRRARARRSGTPRRRAMAAWRDAVDTLRVAGIGVGLGSTTGEVLDASRGSLAEIMRPLADLVNRAAFAPEGIPSEGADFAWQCSDAVRAELHRRTSFAGRLRELVDLRPLLPSTRAARR